MFGLKKKKIALVLGSGGARGWSHIGVLRAVAESGIPVHCVAGTSMGALVGAAFASSRVTELGTVAVQLDWKQVLRHFVEFNLPRNGLVDGGQIIKFLRDYISPLPIENLAMPFAAVATDISSGEPVIIDRGDLMSAVRASIAIPGLFTPLNLNGRFLVDGGMVNPVPVNVARSMGADFVIAVNLNRNLAKRSTALPEHAADKTPASRVERLHKKLEALVRNMNSGKSPVDTDRLKHLDFWFIKKNDPSIFDVLGNSLRIMETRMAEIMLKNDPPDILIEPELNNFEFMEFQRASEAIEIGYAEAMRIFRENAKIIDRIRK